MENFDESILLFSFSIFFCKCYIFILIEKEKTCLITNIRGYIRERRLVEIRKPLYPPHFIIQSITLHYYQRKSLIFAKIKMKGHNVT